MGGAGRGNKGRPRTPLRACGRAPSGVFAWPARVNPVGNDYATLLDGFFWRLRSARGREWRKNVFGGGHTAVFKRTRGWFPAGITDERRFPL